MAPVRAHPAARARPAGAPSSRKQPAEPDPRRIHTVAALDNLRRVVRALRVAAGSTASSTGLTAAQLFVLQVVHAEPGSSLTQIAARTMTDRTSVAAVVDRLVERGLAERRPSQADRRRVDIVATRAGAAVLARAPHPPTRRVLDGLAALDARDLRRLSVGLAALARAMNLDGEPAVMLFDDGPAPAPIGGRARRAGPVTA